MVKKLDCKYLLSFGVSVFPSVRDLVVRIGGDACNMLGRWYLALTRAMLVTFTDYIPSYTDISNGWKILDLTTL